MRREGISTPTHPSYSIGSTHKRKNKVAKTLLRHCTRLERNTGKQEKQDSAGYHILGLRSLSSTCIRVDVVRDRGNVLARMSHPMHTYLLGREKNQSIRSSADTHTNKHKTPANMEPECQLLDLYQHPNQNTHTLEPKCHSMDLHQLPSTQQHNKLIGSRGLSL